MTRSARHLAGVFASEGVGARAVAWVSLWGQRNEKATDMTDFSERYRQIGAQLHGGAPVRRTVPLPPPSIPQVAVPTASMTIDGIALEPAARLTALAAIRDQHRGRARMASDKMHAIREQIAERELRIRMIGQRISPGFEEQAEGEIAVLKAECDQLRAAQMAASDEATEAGEAAGAAGRLFKSALKFCDDHGITVSVMYAGERR